eukprot:249957-Chlamydomonas_euryale.AAC.1
MLGWLVRMLGRPMRMLAAHTAHSRHLYVQAAEDGLARAPCFLRMHPVACPLAALHPRHESSAAPPLRRWSRGDGGRLQLLRLMEGGEHQLLHL